MSLATHDDIDFGNLPITTRNGSHVDSDLPTLIPNTGICRRYVDLFGPLTEASDESHFVVSLALLGSIVGWRGKVKFGTHEEPCTLYILLAATSGMGRKTTALRNGEYIISRGGLSVSLSQLGHTSGLGLIEKIAPPDEMQAKLWETIPPPSHLFSWDEFGHALTDDNWRQDIRGQLMKLAAGRSDGSQTGGSKIPPSRVAVSMIGTITSRDLTQRITSGVANAGFLGRWLIIPENESDRVIAIPREMGDDELAERMEIVRWFAALDQALEGVGDLGDAYQRFSSGARDYWTRWYTERRVRYREARLEHDGNEEELAEGQFARLQALGVRVALLLALADWEPDTPVGATVIQERHVRHAGELVDICLARVLELATTPSTNAVDEWLDRVERHLQRQPDPVRRRDIYNNVRKPAELRLSNVDLWQYVERDPRFVVIPPDTSPHRGRSGERLTLSVLVTD